MNNDFSDDGSASNGTNQQVDCRRLLLLDPARVRIWRGNARNYEALTEEEARELIDSMLMAGGQKVPAVVRAVSEDPDHEYEAIVGTRRHWAVSWLRANGYPEMWFLAQEAELDDAGAFQLADLENRARKDVSDLERARNYAEALNRYYDGHLRGMAQGLKVSPGWLSKTIKIAAIPDEVIAAFAHSGDLQTKPGYALAKALEDEEEAERIRTRAANLAAEQLGRRERGERELTSTEVMRLLLRDTGPSSNSREAQAWRASDGRPIMSIKAKDKEGLLLRLHAGSGAHTEELVAAFRDAVADFDAGAQQNLSWR